MTCDDDDFDRARAASDAAEAALNIAERETLGARIIATLACAAGAGRGPAGNTACAAAGTNFVLKVLAERDAFNADINAGSKAWRERIEYLACVSNHKTYY